MRHHTKLPKPKMRWRREEDSTWRRISKGIGERSVLIAGRGRGEAPGGETPAPAAREDDRLEGVPEETQLRGRHPPPLRVPSSPSPSFPEETAAAERSVR